MRLIPITMLVFVGAFGCARSAGFADARDDAAALRRGFESLAPVDVPEKAKRLQPLAEKRGPALVAALEGLTPTPAQASCHADALAGARRSAGAMKDLLAVYRHAPVEPARAVAAARNIDEGLAQLESALAACSSR